MKRFTALALVLVMCASFVLTSCGGDKNGDDADNGNDTSVQNTGDEDIFAEYRSINLNGRTVKVSVSENVSEHGEGMPSSYLYIAGPDEDSPERVQSNVYHRNLEVAQMLNCKLEHIPVDLSYDNVASYVESMVNSNDTSISYYVNDQFGFLNLAQKGMLLDLQDPLNFDEYYFNFDGDEYYGEYMKGMMVGDRRYIVTGDYFIDTLRACHVLYFNKNIYTDKFGNFEDLYNLVLDGNWTLDKFNSIVDQAYTDADGDGLKNEADIYGLAGHTLNWKEPFLTFYYSTDAQVIDYDADNIPYINKDKLLRLSTVAEKLIPLDKSVGMWQTDVVEDTVSKFINGGTLFTMYQKIGDIEKGQMRDFDGMGLVPYPKLDENQTKHLTLVHDTAEVGAIPTIITGENASVASAVIQVMSVHSHKYLLNDYYETALKSRYVQDPYSAKMLDIVVDGIYAPFDLAYELVIGYGPVNAAIARGNDVTQSAFKSNEKRANKMLNDIIEAYIG